MDLLRRLRYSGYLDRIGITETDPGEVFERVVDHMAATHEWANATSASGAVKGKGVSTGSGSDRVKSSKKKPAKKTSKSRKTNPVQPPPDEIVSEPVKLYYLIDRRDFLEKVKSVYTAYA